MERVEYSQHVISLILLVLTLFSVNVFSIYKTTTTTVLAFIMLILAVIYVTLINMDIIEEASVKLKYYGSVFDKSHEDKAIEINLKSMKNREKLELQLFVTITWLLASLVFIMIWEVIFEKASSCFKWQHIETIKYIITLAIIGAIAMITRTKVYSELRNYLISYPIRVRFLPPELITITHSPQNSDKLVIYIKNLGTQTIMPKLHITFPENVIFWFKNKEIKKREFTEKDYKEITGKDLKIEPNHEKRIILHPVYIGKSVRDYGFTEITVETEGIILGKELKTRLLGQQDKN